MKKRYLIISLIFMLLASISIIACGGQGGNGEPKITGISISEMPHKNKYYVGEDIDLSGGNVIIYYSNNEYIAKPMSEMSVSYDFSKSGIAKVTVSYLDFEANFDVTVEEVGALKLEIVSAPTVIDCKNGRVSVDYSVGAVDIKYKNGETAQKKMNDSELVMSLSEYSWDYLNSEVRVKLTAKHRGAEDSCILTVTDIKASNFEVVEAPLHKNYFVGDTVNLSEGLAKIDSDSGFSAYVWMTENYIQAEYDFSVVGEAEVTVGLQNLSDTFSVKILPAFDRKYFDELFDNVDWAFYFANIEGYDSEFLLYYYRLAEQVDAILGGNNDFVAEFEAEYEFYFKDYKEFFILSFETAFSLFSIGDEFWEFLTLYFEMYESYYLEYYNSGGYFLNEENLARAESLIEMFYALSDEDVKALFLSVKDSGDAYFDFTEDYYGKYLDEIELGAYYYLFWGKHTYATYLFNERYATLGSSMDYIYESMRFYDQIDDQTKFDGFFGKLYLEYVDIYWAYNSIRPTGYDWVNLKEIIRRFWTNHNKNNYVLMVYYYNQLIEEQAYFESIKNTNSDISKHYNEIESDSVTECIEIFDYKLKTPAKELFEGAGLAYINYFCEAAYAYSIGDTTINLFDTAKEIDLRRAELTSIQLALLQYHLMGYWGYFMNIHWDAYCPEYVSEEEANVYSYLLSAEAYYIDMTSEVRGDGYEEYFTIRFKSIMQQTRIYYIRLSKESKENFDLYFGELYSYWTYLFDHYIFPDYE